ncbi:30S ribosomal protein S16 [Spiribacter vilamensis]|uniref:Small ribosomal subunit protein bS16 n=1 Tax=Spiribacter vilamensis TaxID=531306 RepID=A0A4V2GIW3_9GAMM|nr:30S ribosomal protein S16 [Spiribacter vilamensis]RZU98005.1 SSU ribosomal protein S16P [Spiribacter vilamensis]TVO61088.1 30S ribosomal protein S16 [Spiribacter vilamensis]
MVTIRLARAGAKKRPFYHVVVTDSRNGRDGSFIERLGFLNPVARGQEISYKLDLERAEQWISQGAQPSERARQLIRQARRGAAEGAESA